MTQLRTPVPVLQQRTSTWTGWFFRHRSSAKSFRSHRQVVVTGKTMKSPPPSTGSSIYGPPFTLFAKSDDVPTHNALGDQSLPHMRASTDISDCRAERKCVSNYDKYFSGDLVSAPVLYRCRRRAEGGGGTIRNLVTQRFSILPMICALCPKHVLKTLTTPIFKRSL